MKRNTPLDARIEDAERRRDDWLRSLVTATHKVQYYSHRVAALRRQQRRSAHQGGSRAIRVRE